MKHIRYLKLTMSMIMIIAASYYGFALFNAGEFNPVEWSYNSQKYFIIVIIGCIITYLVFTLEPPKFK